MSGILEFGDRGSFREWLTKNGTSSDGVWLLFGKKGGPVTLSAQEALEEALCFGWIDGQMQSLDSTKYKKYFARRIAKSKWSEKNKKLAQSLLEQGIMTPQGIAAVDAAKKNGMWNAPTRTSASDEQIQAFKQLIKGREPAYSNFLAMSLSVQETYTSFYLDAKMPKTQETRLEKIIDRLNQNLRPM